MMLLLGVCTILTGGDVNEANGNFSPLPALVQTAPATQPPAPEREKSAVQTAPYISSVFYNETEFRQTVTQAKKYELKGEVVAGVVPHHLLAGEMIASFFSTVADETYETILFVAPNHNPVNNPIVTTLSDWQTPYGVVKNDTKLTRSFMENGTIRAVADSKIMQEDHAITGLIPYVSYYLPDVSVTGLLIKNGTSWQQLEAMVELALKASENKKVLLIASVDFSHYLMPERAKICDEETRQAILMFDEKSITSWGDEHMDSPESIRIFLKYAQARSAVWHEWDHDSADKILGLPLTDPLYADGITTYFIWSAMKEVS